MIFSIVRIVEPGALCSHPAGRTEVQFTYAYKSATAERTHEGAGAAAYELCEMFNRCCTISGMRYVVEEIDEESPDRAPLEIA